MSDLHPIFFIVGNSRSGTTMMLRILSNHPMIYGLNELHFFENLWSSADKTKRLDNNQAATLASKLLFIQRDGYIGKTQSSRYLKEAKAIIESAGSGEHLPQDVLREVMLYETRKHGAEIPCEKTPQNVFYLQEIFEFFPNARVINMIRDPRAVMLSQKRKWRRRKMGADFITPWEVFRLRVNYHPITLGKLWNAAVSAVQPFENDDRVINIHFEDVLKDPAATARDICQHLNIEYLPEMLDIPQASSSNRADSEERGINKDRAGNWKSEGLSKAEIRWCQKISGRLMEENGYALEPVKGSTLAMIWYALIFPLKIVLAVLINLNRMKNVGESIKKRQA